MYTMNMFFMFDPVSRTSRYPDDFRLKPKRPDKRGSTVYQAHILPGLKI